jgi:hypothetical protein
MNKHFLALPVFCVIGLVATLTKCSGYALPQTTTSATIIATHTEVATGKPAEPTPIPTVTLTRQEEIVEEFVQSGDVRSINKCSSDVMVACYVLQGVAQIMRPEWTELLPETEFYLVKRMLFADVPRQLNVLIIEQDGQRYKANTFDRLLEVNGVVVTDENHESVAKTWALMTVPDYLGEEVIFTKWEKVTYTAEQAIPPYNYNLQAWTKLGGYEVGWQFVFGNTQLEVASGPHVGKSQTGDYVEEPFGPFNGFQDAFQNYIFGGNGP